MSNPNLPATKYLEKILDGDLEYARYRYKKYGLGFYDTWIAHKDRKTKEVISNRIFNVVNCVPIIYTNDKWIVDTQKFELSNIFMVCPVGCRVQTYSTGSNWDITPLFENEVTLVSSSEEYKSRALNKAIERILRLIDINSNE